MVRELATLLGGQLCFTRPMVEGGFGDAAHQIGLSGRTVKPKLIIACGISGAGQHLKGIKDASTIVAINIDPGARIFKNCDYGIVGDVMEILPLLAAALDTGEKLPAPPGRWGCPWGCPR